MRKTNGETVKKEKRNTDFVKLIGIFSVMLVLLTFTGCLGFGCGSECNDDDGGYAYIAYADDGFGCAHSELCIAGIMSDFLDVGWNYMGLGYYSGCDLYAGLATSGCCGATDQDMDNTFAVVIGCGKSECGIGCLDGCPCVWMEGEDGTKFGEVLPDLYVLDQTYQMVETYEKVDQALSGCDG